MQTDHKRMHTQHVKMSFISSGLLVTQLQSNLWSKACATSSCTAARVGTGITGLGCHIHFQR
jgi:hypothetical protein